MEDNLKNAIIELYNRAIFINNISDMSNINNISVYQTWKKFNAFCYTKIFR